MTAMNGQHNIETATFGGGCFWCLEAVFSRIKGVESVESGYSGGFVKNPSYKEVCKGVTGHAEVVQIKFNPMVISYHDLLDVFFSIHDPTTLNRQGNDVGTQYRSAIFYHNEQQLITAKAFINHLTVNKVHSQDIVTQLQPFEVFYKAEDYHQDYYDNNASQSYCVYVVQPKISKLHKNFKPLLK
jgi:peptide-methionine (S)-S-oxide reductase